MSGTLADQLAAKGINLYEPKTIPQVSKKTRRKWNHAKGGQRSSLGWIHDLFGELMVYISNFELEGQKDSGGYYWAGINLANSTPPALFVRFAANLSANVVGVFFAQGGDVTDASSGKIPFIEVPIEWNNMNGVTVPHTRARNVDNADIVLLLNSGAFMQLQVSVLTRGGKFFLSVQEIWAGEILEFEGDAGSLGSCMVGDKAYTVSPLWSEQAYPGASYLKTMRNMGPKIVALATEFDNCDIAAVSELPVVGWDPPAFPEGDKGWVGGVVTFFNPIVMGRALLEDGTDVYINLQAILNKDGMPEMSRGGFPLLQPKQQILLRWKKGDKGTYATAVKALPMQE